VVAGREFCGYGCGAAENSPRDTHVHHYSGWPCYKAKTVKKDQIKRRNRASLGRTFGFAFNLRCVGRNPSRNGFLFLVRKGHDLETTKESLRQLSGNLE